MTFAKWWEELPLALVQGVIFLWIIGAVLVGVLATRRARSGPAWLGISLLVSPLIAMVALLTKSSGRVRCEACAELIWPQAAVCPHCRTPREPVRQ